MEIPFYNFNYQHKQIEKEVRQVFQEVFDSSWFVQGNKVKLFEQQYADYIGVKHCIGVGNGFDALTLSLRALGIGKGDEVLVPAHTFIATILSIKAAGAQPVLVDVDSNTFNIDATLLEKHITPRTKVIIPVHLYGLVCEMEDIITLASKHGLYIVEDNAQASGAEYKGKKTGSFGHINAHSFYPTKNLGALGDGGAITTNDDELARKVRLLGNYGSSIKYHHESQGSNSRLDEIQAAVLSIKLKFLDQWIEDKRQLVLNYQEGLSVVKQVICPLLPVEEKRHSSHLYVIKTSQRDALATHLKSNQINTLVHYPIPVYQQKAFAKEFDINAYPVTERLASEILSLPLFPGMTMEQVARVVFQVRQFNF